MDMHKLEFDDATFNFVFSSHSLEHSPEPGTVIKEIYRVAKNGAYVLIEVPVNNKITHADLIDFKKMEDVIALFPNRSIKLIWDRIAKKGEAGNFAGNDVVSFLCQINKKHAA
jgi:ubiquinone/menaquinone biosynthesis C-methylase UbiE